MIPICRTYSPGLVVVRDTCVLRRRRFSTHTSRKPVLNKILLYYALILPLIMNNNRDHYYHAEDLKKFNQIGKFGKELADKFFEYYGAVFADGALTAREKSLIALAVAHTVQCPYCIDAYATDATEKGCSEKQMMEAVHVAAAIRSGSSLVHSVQMMNKVKEISM